jgi:hypothetical protein
MRSKSENRIISITQLSVSSRGRRDQTDDPLFDAIAAGPGAEGGGRCASAVRASESFVRRRHSSSEIAPTISAQQSEHSSTSIAEWAFSRSAAGSSIASSSLCRTRVRRRRRGGREAGRSQSSQVIHPGARKRAIESCLLVVDAFLGIDEVITDAALAKRPRTSEHSRCQLRLGQWRAKHGFAITAGIARQLRCERATAALHCTARDNLVKILRNGLRWLSRSRSIGLWWRSRHAGGFGLTYGSRTGHCRERARSGARRLG